MKKEKKSKKFYDAGLSEVSFFAETCIQHKELVGIFVVISGSVFTGLQISQMGIDMLPFFMNTSNMVNIMLQLFLFIIIIGMLFMGIMLFYDIVHYISKVIIKCKRWLVEGSEYSDTSREINPLFFQKNIIRLTYVVFFLFVIVVSHMVINNYPHVTVKTGFDEEAYLGQIIYNTGQGYIFYIEGAYVFIPNTKIEYINMGNPNQRATIGKS